MGNDPSKEECSFDAEVWKVFDDDFTSSLPIVEITSGYLHYFCSPLSYMLAYAIYLKYDRIRIYGFDSDDFSDKPRITYWLGVAKGLGIECEIAETSKLHRVIKDNIKKRYRGMRTLRGSGAPSDEYLDFVKAARVHGDPFCFVSGVDKDAVTVTVRNADGWEVGKWHN